MRRTSGSAQHVARDRIERLAPLESGARPSPARTSALDAAAVAYTASHGHPLEHPPAGGPTGPRWHLRLRLAVVAGLAIALLGAGVTARAVLGAPSAAVALTPAPVGAGQLDPTAGPWSSQSTRAGPGQADPTASSSVPTAAAIVVIDVEGLVAHPGVIRIAAGSRVVDAVAAAGGASAGADLTALNLARIVVDGEQLVVPAPGGVPASAPGPGGASQGASAGPSGAPLDLNSADLAALDALPGIGPVLAQRVLDWRAAHGRFTEVDELGEVPGIGDTLLGRLRDLVRV